MGSTGPEAVVTHSSPQTDNGSPISHTLLRLGVRVLRLMVTAGLYLLFFLFVALLALQFPHPEKIDQMEAVVLMHKVGDFLLAPIDRALGWEDAVAFYLLSMAFVCSVLLIVLDINLLGLRKRLERRRR